MNMYRGFLKHVIKSGTSHVFYQLLLNCSARQPFRCRCPAHAPLLTSGAPNTMGLTHKTLLSH